jgi:chemotaxis protein MotB
MPTFADLMTLLMCFFVLLLSFSEMDVAKFKRLAGSMESAFGVQARLRVEEIPKGTSVIAQQFSPGKPEPTPINEIYQHTDQVTELTLDVDCSAEFKDVETSADAPSEDQPPASGQQESGAQASKGRIQELIQETREDATDLANELKDQIARGEVEVETQGRKIIVRIREKGSFPSGSAQLAVEYLGVLQKVRDILSGKHGQIQVHGHTDNVPIATARFRSNWELSSARAVSVAHELLREGKLNPARFTVAGYSDTRPLVSNDNTEDRARNRRVEIVIQQGFDREAKNDLRVLQAEDQVFYESLDVDEFDSPFDLNPSEVF